VVLLPRPIVVVLCGVAAATRARPA